MSYRSFQAAGLLLFLLIGGLPLFAGDIVDRIVATVNGHIILQSDWEDALRFEAFTSNRSTAQLTAEDRKASLDRLIDQELLREQMRSADFLHATAEEVNTRVAELRKQYSVADNEQGWRGELTRYGLTEDEVRERISSELDALRLVDARLRPSVNIDSNSIESYYHQELLPQLRQSGAKEVALTDVSPKIKELLTEQKVNELLLAWLQNLRAGSSIRTEAASSADMGQVQ
jgi:peptidyl-prolyl cis-trans isomerase SurA